jgi:twitching motility protein PilT
MNGPNRRRTPLLVRIATQLDMMDDEQAARLRTAQDAAPDRKLTDLLIELDIVSNVQLARLLQVQRDVVARHRARNEAPAPTASPEPAATSVRDAPSGRIAPMAAMTPAGAPGSAQTPSDRTPAALPENPQTDAEDAGLGLALHPGPGDRGALEHILQSALDSGASDIHIHAGAPLRLRVNGAMGSTATAPMTPEETEQLVLASLDPDQQRELSETGEIDHCLTLEGIGRFRLNAYRQQRGFDAVYRAIPASPPTLEELGLPSTLERFTRFHQGLVLVTGPAGCGKSATMAALVDQINQEREDHILTVEDPIEYIHPSKRCHVNQRHAGRHTQDFARALRAALREDPDVIVIGELRDLETISLALTAAETGHLVLATLHTANAVRTINRMIGAFPSNRQDQVRTMLSESLRAVISQRLVPTADETQRVPALEVLVVNKAISNLIREAKTVQIRSAIQTGASQGMRLLEQSLSELVSSGTITPEQALALAEDKKLLQG